MVFFLTHKLLSMVSSLKFPVIFASFSCCSYQALLIIPPYSSFLSFLLPVPASLTSVPPSANRQICIPHSQTFVAFQLQVTNPVQTDKLKKKCIGAHLTKKAKGLYFQAWLNLGTQALSLGIFLPSSLGYGLAALLSTVSQNVTKQPPPPVGFY